MKRLLYLQEKASCHDIPEQVFASVISYLPPKFLSYEKEEHTWRGRYDKRGCRFHGVESKDYESNELNIILIKINIKALAWLEQQDELKRINLDEKERALMLSMKEAMKVHDDAVTFDGYIEDWAHKLLNEFKIPYITHRQYQKMMKKRYDKRRKEKKSAQDKVIEQVMLAMERDEEVKKKVEEILNGD
jgi:hypothetical protein